MEFDKNKVYSTVNAEDLKVGSKCYFANNLDSLKFLFKNDSPIEVLSYIENETHPYRFRKKGHSEQYGLAYLIEPPKEKEYKAFSSIEKAVEEIKKHSGWLKKIDTGSTFLLIGYKSEPEQCVQVQSYWYTLADLFSVFIFADDGTPCGELVEEED